MRRVNAVGIPVSSLEPEGFQSHLIRERFRRFKHDWAEDFSRINGLRKAEVLRTIGEFVDEDHD